MKDLLAIVLRIFYADMVKENKDSSTGLLCLARHPIGHGIAVSNAEFLSLRHKRDLGVTSSEMMRFLKKSAHLALCYSGFAVSHRIEEYIGAGRAAFLCCAYDVITDWRSFDSASGDKFENMLEAYADSTLKDLAIQLYEKDRDNSLDDNGLERGSIALRFVTEMMEVRVRLEDKGVDIDATGRLLQLVDDILDLEDDAKAGEANCLLSPRRNSYLQELITADIERHFDPGSVLNLMIEKARRKAERLLRC